MKEELQAIKSHASEVRHSFRMHLFVSIKELLAFKVSTPLAIPHETQRHRQCYRVK